MQLHLQLYCSISTQNFTYGVWKKLRRTSKSSWVSQRCAGRACTKRSSEEVHHHSVQCFAHRPPSTSLPFSHKLVIAYCSRKYIVRLHRGQVALHRGWIDTYDLNVNSAALRAIFPFPALCLCPLENMQWGRRNERRTTTTCNLLGGLILRTSADVVEVGRWRSLEITFSPFHCNPTLMPWLKTFSRPFTI